MRDLAEQHFVVHAKNRDVVGNVQAKLAHGLHEFKSPQVIGREKRQRAGKRGKPRAHGGGLLFLRAPECRRSRASPGAKARECELRYVVAAIRLSAGTEGAL